MFLLDTVGNIPLYRLKVDTELVEIVGREAEEQFARFLDISKKYEPTKEGSSYRFRSPVSLTEDVLGPGYQWIIEDSDSNKYLRNLVVAEAAKVLNESLRVHDNWFLLQTDSGWVDNPYHTHDTSDWTLVNYIKTNPEDSISLKDENDVEHIIKVEPGLSILFPSSVLHKPNQNTASENRISLNMEIAIAEVN